MIGNRVLVLGEAGTIMYETDGFADVLMDEGFMLMNVPEEYIEAMPDDIA